MRILISNDDGVFASGLKALVSNLAGSHELTIVAPDREQSAVSHGLTIRRPLFTSDWTVAGLPALGVSGTPADCVKLGIDQIMADNPPDLVLTGINNGPNTGINVFYSGTVAGAMEANFLEIPAIAVSVASFNPSHYDTAAVIAAKVVKFYEEVPFPGNNTLNINVPDLPLEQLQGVRICRQSRLKYKDHYVPKEAPNGRTYYWLDGDHPQVNDDLSLDDCALKKGWVSITPVKADFNADEKIMGETAKWLNQEDLQTIFSLQHL